MGEDECGTSIRSYGGPYVSYVHIENGLVIFYYIQHLASGTTILILSGSL